MNKTDFDSYILAQAPAYYSTWIRWQENLITQANYIEELEYCLSQGENFNTCQVEKLRAVLINSSTVNLTNLYTVVQRHGRLTLLLKAKAPDMIINTEKRLLQHAINSL